VPARSLLILHAVRGGLRALWRISWRYPANTHLLVALLSFFVRIFKELRLCERFPGFGPLLERSRLAGEVRR